MESEEGNNSANIRMTQALGTEPLPNFSRDKDIAAQFIQLLRALQQQERRQHWPMLDSLTIQMEHCDYCFQDYCSPINYKRHTEFHRRDFEEESAKNRILLAQFWDKISPEEAKEVVSFKDFLKEVSGSSIIKKLTTTVRKAGFSYLPEPYLKSGSQILDIIEGCGFPISSEQLLTVLDCTSEKTFLCGQTSSLQKYIYDGNNTEKMVLEIRNVIAYTGIQLEQKLIGAWLVDREAESERFSKILEDEEEVARKGRAEALEKKKQKKLRKREQKENKQGAELKEDIEMTSEEPSSAVEQTNPDVVASDGHTVLGSGEIDLGCGSNVDESPFSPVVGRKWSQRVSRSSEAVEPTSSQEAQGSQASTLALDSQSPKLIQSPVKSHQKAQDSQASNLDLTSKPQKLAIFPTNSRPAQDSQAPIFAGFPTYSHTLQGRQGLNLSHAPSRPHSPQQNYQAPELPDWPTISHRAPSSATGPRASHAKSRPPWYRSRRTASSTSRIILTSNGEPALGGGQKDSTPVYTILSPTPERQDRVETEPPNEQATAKEEDEKERSEVTPSSTSERVNWANMVEDEAREEPEAPTKEQDTTNEHDPTKEHKVMIGSLPVSINQEFGSLPISFGALNLKEHDNSEASRTIPPAEDQKSEDGSTRDEPEEPDPVASGPTAVAWTETLVLNGSRELDAGFVNMKGNLFRNMSWESAIHIAAAFNKQRWKKAIEGEHVTVSLVPAYEHAT